MLKQLQLWPDSQFIDGVASAAGIKIRLVA